MNKLQYLILYYCSNFITKENLIDKLRENNIIIDERTLRNEIRKMVLQGYTIISECVEKQKGYKVEKDINKIMNNAERLKKRGVKIIERAEKLKRIAIDLQSGTLL